MIETETHHSEKTIASRYEKLAERRRSFLNRARQCSEVTIPSLIPREGTTGDSELPKPYQSIGAQAVNNLSSKLLLTLMPPTRKFFRLMVSDKAEAEIPEGAKSDFQQALSMMESRIIQEMEALALRVNVYEAFRHLVVAGNVLIQIGKDFTKVYPLTQYVCSRDSEGKLLEIIVKELVSIEALPDEVAVEVAGQDKDADDKDLELYTHIYLEDGKWYVCQEVRGIPFGEETYGERKLPWLALRWTRLDGEDYGRSHCDDYIGDLLTAEGLTKSIVEFAAIASKAIFLCRPNGMTRAEDVAKAVAGDIVEGDKEDFSVIGLEKFADFQVSNTVLEETKTRIRHAFLLNSAVTRQAERVTAEEIRFLAGELEDALGGVYSVLSLEFQLRIVQVVMSMMESEGKLPKLPKDTVKPTVITGIDGLGRSHELNRLDAFIGGIIQTFGPEAMAHVKIGDYLKRRASALDLDIKGLIKTDEEVQAERQQAAQMQMVEKLGPPTIQAMSKQQQTA